MQGDKVKQLLFQDGCYVGHHSTQLWLWRAVEGLAEARHAIALVIYIIVVLCGGITAGLATFLVWMFAQTWHYSNAYSELQEYIANRTAIIERARKIVAETKSSEDIHEDEQVAIELRELKEVLDPRVWRAATKSYNLLTHSAAGILITAFTPACSLLLIAAAVVPKFSAPLVYAYVRWHHRQAQTQAKDETINTEWLQFGEWMIKNNIPRQSPAGFVETYARFLKSKEPAEIAETKV